jgi:acylphosphatase
MMPRERRRVYYAGRVQGVGFRYTAERLAKGFAVTGFVRNLDDGRVELVAEGEPAEVDAFLGAVRDTLGSKIQSTQATSEPPSDPPESGFSIRY